MLLRDAQKLVPIFLIWSAVTYVTLLLDERLGITGTLWMLSTDLLTDPIFLGAVCFMALQDEGLSSNSSFRQAFARYGGLLALYLLSSLGMALGFLLLILPGIALAVLWSIAFPIFMMEGRGPVASLTASFEAIKGEFWRVLGVFAAFAVVVGVLFVIVAALSLGDLMLDLGIYLIASAAFGTLVSIVSIYLNAAIYRELGFAGAHDVSVFD